MESLIVSAAPHIRGTNTTTKIMLNVIIALIPTLVASVIIFGIRALVLTVTCAASAVVFEYLCRRVMKREQTIGDLSAVVTGILTAFCLPVTLPLWMAVAGSFIAIVAVKQIFGGIGENFANPAATARLILTLSFSAEFSTKWTLPFERNYDGANTVSAATPLASGFEDISYFDLFIGNNSGSLGETCALAIILGGAYLLFRGIIDFVIPLFFIGTSVLWSFLFGLDPLMQVLSGGMLLGAFFMATDYSTSPVTRTGKIIFAVGCGTVTMLIRSFGEFPEGVAFSIVIMNLIVPFINRATLSKPFGAIRT